MDFLKDFGVQPVLLAAQVVNFLILLFILKKFLYKPILKVLDARKQKIEDSLKNAEEIEKRLNEITEKEAQALLRSAREGEKLIREAGDEYTRIIEDAKKEYERIINKAVEDSKKLIEQQQLHLMSQVKDNLSGIVLLGLEKVLGKKVTKDQKKLVEEVLRES